MALIESFSGLTKRGYVLSEKQRRAKEPDLKDFE